MPNVTPLRPDDPRRVGRYRLIGRVDELAGDDARPPEVFAAQRVDGDTMLVTLLGPGRASDAAARDRFAAEARLARRIPPFCVTRILDAGFESGQPYLITESVAGPTLAQVVATEGPLSPQAVRALAIGCATALTAIHQTGLVHGQFGPNMVVLGPEGPRVVHFSITPPYGAATPAADMLAWAHTLLFAAAGGGPAGPQDLRALPEELRSVVADCLNPDPAGRPLARAALTELLSGADLSAGLLAEGSRLSQAAARATASPAVPVSRQAPRRSHSRAVAWTAACAACVLAIAAAVFYITGRHPGPAPATPARASVVIPARLAGSWAGVVHQTKPVLALTVRLSLAGGTSHGTIAYPQPGCSGMLRLTSADHNMLAFRMTFTAGQKNCVAGKVRLVTRRDGTVAFIFLRPGGRDPTGKLTRQS
jgi:eukaryotic-like serine/threonine-protein kinase